jgi:hypothetical protein
MDQTPEADARERELALIRTHLDARGVTRCPPAFAGAVAAAVPVAEEKRRLAQLPPPPMPKRKRGNWASFGFR